MILKIFGDVYKWVNQKASAAVLAVKRSVGVTSEVNLRNPFVIRILKQGISGPQKRTDVFQKVK